MKTTNAMTVNENGNVNVKSLKIVIIWKATRNSNRNSFRKRSIGKRSQNPNGKKKISIR